jgi:hypothetical protein
LELTPLIIKVGEPLALAAVAADPFSVIKDKPSLATQAIILAVLKPKLLAPASQQDPSLPHLSLT